MRTKSTAPTMKDVAQEAGVALGTVSRVFNGIPVGESYRVRVEEAAARLGYQVNNYARGLKTNKTYTVAVIMPYITHPFFGGLTEHICRALAARGYRTMLAVTSSDLTVEQHCLEMVQQNKVDGIIALTYNPDLTVEDSLPFVSIDRFYSSAIPCVSSDNFGGGQLAAETLVKLGCRRLLFLRHGASVPGEPDKRGAGFEAWCREHHIPCDAIRANDEEGLAPLYYFLSEHLREASVEYDGIFCNTDRLAVDIRRFLESRQVRVPGDVQIIGFDGLINEMDGTPYCSSVVQPVKAMAESAVEILLSADRSRLPALTCLPVQYRPGGTTRDSM